MELEAPNIDSALDILDKWVKNRLPTEIVKMTFDEMKSLEECINITEHEKTLLFWSIVQVALQNNFMSGNDDWRGALLECTTNHQMNGQKLSELSSFANIMKYDELNKLSALSIAMIIRLVKYFSVNGVPTSMLEPIA